MTDIVTILREAINITGLIEYVGEIIVAITLVLPDFLTLVVYLIAIGFVAGVIGVIFLFVKGVLDFKSLMARFGKY